MRRCFSIGLVLLALCAAPVRAQFVVESSDPAPGTSGVPTSTVIEFEFSDWVNIETDWNTAFVVEPRDAIAVNQVNLVLDDRGRAAIAQLVVEQEPNTDYTWLIYDVQKPERYGSTPLDEPYVLRYSTRSSIGPHEVAGSVAESPPAAASKRAGAPGVRRRVWQQLAAMAQASGLGRPVFEADSPPDEAPRRTAAKAGAKASEPAPDATSVFLLKRFSARLDDWRVEAGSVFEGSSGSYEVTHVRDGTYWPLAVRYADRARTEIEALGFYDADADGMPDPVAVEGGALSGVDLALAPFPRTTARDNRATAEAAAAAVADDARLVTVRADASADAGGTAYTWTYQYYAPSLDREVLVTVAPTGASTKTQAAFDYITTMPAVPEPFVDSDLALQTALADGGQALVDACPPGDLHVAVEAGNLYWLVPYPTTRVIWRVRLEGDTGPSSPNAETCNQVVERYLDVETGEVLDPSALPVELVAFAARADGSDVVLRWQTAAETDNAGFEVQARFGTREHGSAGAWEALGFVEGAGTTREPQDYRYRVRDLAPGTHRFRLRQVDLDGADAYSPEVEAQIALSDALVVEPPYPNPFSDRATVRIGLREGGAVVVALFDALGRRVRILYTGHVAPGQMRSIPIDARGLASGRYYVRVATDGGRRVRVRPLTVLR